MTHHGQTNPEVAKKLLMLVALILLSNTRESSPSLFAKLNLTFKGTKCPKRVSRLIAL